MATSFKELPLPLQAGAYLALALVLFVAGEYVPGSPINGVRRDLEQAKVQRDSLHKEVTALQVFERQGPQVKAELDAVERELEALKNIVPEDKEVDEFMRMLHESSKAANVALRRLTAKPVTPRDYHYELPFELEVDGPYYQVLDFFSRLSRLSRIINVGDIEFTNAEEAKGKKYPMRPGTTVTGTCMATTFFTAGGATASANAPAKQATPPAKR
ncbi:MAG TPA: type 4a pilus biogenesis protein PilO [Candidatus Acidoferrum sp.]|nr:type 4a pilus biogenesis protein PilO [Candidatus Acidoferrum sp.]